MSESTTSPIETPCVKGCNYDEKAGFCLDCGRTLTEIADWSIVASDRKRAIKHDAKVRKNGIPKD